MCVRSQYTADPVELIARIAIEKRAVLLRVYRRWLRPEDLEDCFSQATLELIARAKRGGCFQGPAHIGNALEQKFCSRIHDRRRAIAGRSASEAAFADALPLGDSEEGGLDVADHRAGIEDAVAARLRLRDVLALAKTLSHDQRLVLACQLQLDCDSRELCSRLGWSVDKYRKVAQRGRARLRSLLDDEHSSVTADTAFAPPGTGTRPTTSVASEKAR